MNKNKEYVVNTLILFMGKFSTQFISFLLLPLYTHYLLTDDFGFVDLLQTYISLIIPIMTLRFDSAVFRFLIDERKKESKKGVIEVISNVLVVIFSIAIIFFIAYLILGVFVSIKYYWYIGINIVVIMFSNIFLQIARGVGHNKDYSISCIITGLSTLIINIILLVGLHFDASSILISSTIANLLCCIYLLYKEKIINMLDVRSLNKNKIKELLKYSIPMIPNALSWWIVNVSDRSIISIVLGASYNGIYSISCKFSNIMNNIFSIFNMSWQESASLHINDSDKEKFFSDMINKLFSFFSCLSLLVIAIIPLAFDIVIGKNYILSYNYIPILMLANIFQILIQLFGGIYIAKKLTKKIMNTTIISAIINLFINVIFISKIGLYAACLSTLISYFIMCIYRYFDIKKYININISYLNITRNIIMFLVCSIFYYVNNVYLNILNFLVVIIYSLSINKKDIIPIFNKIKKKFL